MEPGREATVLLAGGANTRRPGRRGPAQAPANLDALSSMRTTRTQRHPRSWGGRQRWITTAAASASPSKSPFQVKSASLLIVPLLMAATPGGNKDDEVHRNTAAIEGGNGGGLHREVTRFRVKSSLTRTTRHCLLRRKRLFGPGPSTTCQPFFSCYQFF
jgi:hypothetical protein